jgi:hypothetical protein
MSSNHDDFDDLDRLIGSTRASVIAKLDAATDFDAVFADIYARAGRSGSAPGSNTRPAGRSATSDDAGGVDAVCDHIDMLTEVLEAATAHEVRSPVVATLHLSTARRVLLRLRSGLVGRRLARNDAVRLIGNVEHNLREADAVLRTEFGSSLEEELRGRIGELRELGDDISGQLQMLRHKVTRLFDDANDRASLTPAPRS